MKAFNEIGIGGACRFGLSTIATGVLRVLPLPQIRASYLRFLGARIGRDTVIHEVRLFNCYRRGFKGLRIGKECFIGDECMFDLAESITMEDQVTLAERVTVLTHTNVGYHDHPLQSHFPSSQSPVAFRRGCFVGACAVILPGIEIGPSAFVAAGAVVTAAVAANTVVAGVPARVVRTLS